MKNSWLPESLPEAGFPTEKTKVGKIAAGKIAAGKLLARKDRPWKLSSPERSPSANYSPGKIADEKKIICIP